MKHNYITKERYNYIIELVKQSNINVDLDTGVITGKRGGHGYKNNTGYWVFSIYDKNKKKDIILSQHIIIACLGFGEKVIGKQIDHINNNHRIPYDNRLSNLRPITEKENHKKFWDSPYRDNSNFSTPMIYISKTEVKYYSTIISFSREKHISTSYLWKAQKENKYIPKIKGFVVFIGERYLTNH